MTDKEKLSSLLSYVSEDGRICPQPVYWNILYNMLPNAVQAGLSPPLILGAWNIAPGLLKIDRLRQHIEYAAENGVLDLVDQYIRSLNRKQWYYI